MCVLANYVFMCEHSGMENALEHYRLEKKLTYEAIARKVGTYRSVIFSHCTGTRGISPEMAIRYEKCLGISRSVLRPDLWSENM